MDADLNQGPGNSQKGGDHWQLTIEEMGLGSKGPRVLEHTAATHPSSALSSKVHRVLEHATRSDHHTDCAHRVLTECSHYQVLCALSALCIPSAHQSKVPRVLDPAKVSFGNTKRLVHTERSVCTGRSLYRALGEH